jgi:PIN like domain
MESDLSYQKYHGKGTLKSYNNILNLYKNNFNKAVKLEPIFPIFLDTNVLLRTYSISFKAREKSYGFFNKRKKDIYITDKVQTEFIKNREDVINRFSDNVTNKIPNDFRSEVIMHIGSYLERNKIIFRDYEIFEGKLNKIGAQCENLHTDLLEQVEKQEQENFNLIFEDKQLKILSETNCLNPLSDDEIKLCQAEYDSLAKGMDPEKITTIISKVGKVFPGAGDLKEKLDNPYGDYIIFYELMKYSKEKKQDIVFLTYDSTKGDWMRKDKKPHLHYLENFYLNTGQIIFILDAERVFEDLLDISFTSLIQIKDQEKVSTPLTVESLNNLLTNRFDNCPKDVDSSFINDLFLELTENGYSSIEQITFDLNKSDVAFEEYIKVIEKSINRFTRMGNLRIRLYISNANYRVFDRDTKSYINVNRDEYNHFLHLLK